MTCNVSATSAILSEVEEKKKSVWRTQHKPQETVEVLIPFY